MAYLPVPILDECWGFDTAWKLSASAIAQLADADMSSICSAPKGTKPRVFIRYVGRDGPNSLQDIDTHEAQLIRVVGAMLLLVQHCESGSWIANAAKGRSRGEWAVKNAAAAGYTPTAGYEPPCIGLDMESIKNPGPDALAYANEWSAAVGGAGYGPLIYTGFDWGFSLEQLGALPFPLWASPGRTAPPGRRFVMQQGLQKELCGVGIDPDHFMPGSNEPLVVGLGEVDLTVSDVEPHVDPSGPASGPTGAAARRLAATLSAPWRMRRLVLARQRPSALGRHV